MTSLVRVSTLTLLAAALVGAAAGPVRAQAAASGQAAAAPAGRPVEQLFADASAKELAVRKALAARDPQETLLRAVRTVVSDYENVVRRYPTSSYCDDALWRAGKLARDAFEEFEGARERSAALRLFQLLASEYPSSRFAKQVPAQLTWLNAHPAKPGTMPASNGPAAAASSPAGAPAAAPRTRTPPSSSTPAPSSGESAAASRVAPTPVSAQDASASPLVGVKAIRRAVLADVVRVIIELDAEVAFHDERLDNPARVFVDLSSTRANPALIDQTLRFDADTDIVRQIRIGRHPNNVTRIVLEAAGVSSYSVYPLYSPFRLVIDCLRTNPPATVASLPRGELPRSATGVPSIAAATSIAPEPRVAAPPDALPFSWRPLTRIARVDATPVASLDTASPVDTRTSPTAAPAPAATLSTPDRDLPAWATVARTKTLPVLRARRVRWVLPLPAAVVRALPENAPPTVSAGDAATVAATATPPTAPSKPSAPAATLPPGPPVHNVAGGLSIARQLGLGVSRIVIDPGHGGHDPGAKGPGVTEAELVLDVALRLEKLLSKLPGVEVTLTRRENEFIPLQERTAIANREGADLFLSIHANASNVPAARGVETYFLNFASNQNAAAVAARENATSDQTMGSLQDVVKAIALNSKLDESRDFATYVQREMLDSLRPANKTVKDLGVKQAPFVVLIGASMPSVLAEISFVTNPQEAKLLKSGSYRQRIAQALFEGIKKYQVSLKSAATIAQQQN